MTKRKRKLTAAEKKEQKRAKRPSTIDGVDEDDFIRRNADTIWLHQNEMWELLTDDKKGWSDEELTFAPPEKRRKSLSEDYERLKDEIIRDKVDEIFRTRPDDYISALEEIGFKYYEDDDPEEIEEKNARPENQDQKELVDYFEGAGELSESMLETFLSEKDSNLPLMRKYFKQANQRLKSLILFGLERYPARIDLLWDLSYFHEFENVLSTLIGYFTRACVKEANLQTFTELVQEFYYATIEDGYDAFHALRELFEPDSDKRKIIEFLIQEANDADNSPESIPF